MLNLCGQAVSCGRKINWSSHFKSPSDFPRSATGTVAWWETSYPFARKKNEKRILTLRVSAKQIQCTLESPFCPSVQTSFRSSGSPVLPDSERGHNLPACTVCPSSPAGTGLSGTQPHTAPSVCSGSRHLPCSYRLVAHSTRRHPELPSPAELSVMTGMVFLCTGQYGGC